MHPCRAPTPALVFTPYFPLRPLLLRVEKGSPTRSLPRWTVSGYLCGGGSQCRPPPLLASTRRRQASSTCRRPTAPDLDYFQIVVTAPGRRSTSAGKGDEIHPLGTRGVAELEHGSKSPATGRAPTAARARAPLPEPPSTSTMSELRPSPPPPPFVTARRAGRAAGMPDPAHEASSARSSAGGGRGVALHRSSGLPLPLATHKPAVRSGSFAPSYDLGLVATTSDCAWGRIQGCRAGPPSWSSSSPAPRARSGERMGEIERE